MNVSFVLLFALASTLFAQQPASGPQTTGAGAVTGRVFCHDTGQPARFAGVELIATAPETTTPLFDSSTLSKNASLSKAMASALVSIMGHSSHLSTVTALDGAFSIEKVPAGTYYIVPQLAGYLSPLSGLSSKERMKADKATLSTVESEAQKVVVQPDQTSSVLLELQRGASLSGAITYDDGSPAPGVTPILMVRDKDGKWKDLGMLGTLPMPTNDLGAFRFAGLPAGDYAVRAVLPTSQALIGLGPGSFAMHMDLADALVVFNGGALREKDIKPITLAAGEDRDGIEVVFPINGLHTVSGSVVAKFDQHPVNFATIELEDPDSKTPLRTAMVGPDGAFKLNYVPDGSYVLKVAGAADMSQRGGEGFGSLFTMPLNTKPLKEYGSTDLPVTVKSDLDGLVLQVPDAKAEQRADKSQ